jgi:hypothetical protein
MIGFDLLTNFIDDPEALLRKTKAILKRVSAVVSEDSQIRRSLIPEFKAMANKSLCEFSAPTTANIRTRPTMDIGDNGFKLKSARETMDIAAGGAFLSLTLRDTTTLVEKMASN